MTRARYIGMALRVGMSAREALLLEISEVIGVIESRGQDNAAPEREED